MIKLLLPFLLQDRRYADLTEDQLPSCESLKDTIARALPFWNEEIVPQIKEGKRVLIAAHGNSLRGIVKHLEGEYSVCNFGAKADLSLTESKKLVEPKLSGK